MTSLATYRRSVLHAAHLPVYDFLAPSFIQIPRASRVRYISTTRKLAAIPDQSSNTPNPGQSASSNAPSLKKPLTQAQREFLSQAVRTPSMHTEAGSNGSLVPSQPGRRIGRYSDLHRPNASHCGLSSAPSSSHEAHV
jgi:hypothetical protein